MQWRDLTGGLLISALASGGAWAQETTTVEAETTAGEEKPEELFSGWAYAQYRMLAVADEDPANDQYLVYRMRGMGQVFKDATLHVEFGVTQEFVAEPDESGVFFQDTAVALRYATPADLGPRTLKLVHEPLVFLPTSRASQTQDLHVAPQYTLRSSMEVIERLTVLFRPMVQYRVHQYAERAGLQGGMNTQVKWGGRFGADYTAIESERFGDFGFGFSTATYWHKRYASRDDHIARTADQAPVLQVYDWEVHAGYMPWEFVSIDVSVEHGGGVLRDGIVNTFLTHRDETELAFMVTGLY